jgi:hypothetical protein
MSSPLFTFPNNQTFSFDGLISIRQVLTNSEFGSSGTAVKFWYKIELSYNTGLREVYIEPKDIEDEYRRLKYEWESWLNYKALIGHNYWPNSYVQTNTSNIKWTEGITDGTAQWYKDYIQGISKTNG